MSRLDISDADETEDNVALQSPYIDSMGPNTCMLPLSSVHISRKLEMLNEAGIKTIEDLVSAPVAELLKLPALGRRTLRHYYQKIELVNKALDQTGEIDWGAFCDLLSIPLLPEGPAPLNGSEFLKVLPALSQQVADQLESPLERAILLDRLVKPRELQSTLEEIALSADVPITRERVRQLEVRLLSQLSDAFLYDEYGDLPVHFHAGFSNYWKSAAQMFSNYKELSLEEFCSRLCNCWSVNYDELLEHLSFILAVLTSKSQLPRNLRPTKGLMGWSLNNLHGAARTLSVELLPFGHYYRYLLDLEIQSVGQLVDILKYNRANSLPVYVVAKVGNLLNLFNKAVNANGDIDWSSWASVLEQKIVPSALVGFEEFLTSLNDNIDVILRESATAETSSKVFRLRTSRGADEQSTLSDVGRVLSLKNVKSTETRFLTMLYEQLIGRNLTRAHVVYRPEFLEYWSKINDIYKDSDGNYEKFCDRLIEVWQVPANIVKVSGPTIWAVLNGYPQVRPRKRWAKKSPKVRPQPTVDGVIVLRGFRRAH